MPSAQTNYLRLLTTVIHVTTFKDVYLATITLKLTGQESLTVYISFFQIAIVVSDNVHNMLDCYQLPKIPSTVTVWFHAIVQNNACI